MHKEILKCKTSNYNKNRAETSTVTEITSKTEKAFIAKQSSNFNSLAKKYKVSIKECFFFIGYNTQILRRKKKEKKDWQLNFEYS